MGLVETVEDRGVQSAGGVGLMQKLADTEFMAEKNTAHVEVL